MRTLGLALLAGPRSGCSTGISAQDFCAKYRLAYGEGPSRCYGGPADLWRNEVDQYGYCGTYLAPAPKGRHVSP